jgi:hypothetical protein
MRERAAAISHSPATFLSFEVMILRRNRGLAASPPVRYRLKMAGRFLRCARLEIGVRECHSAFHCLPLIRDVLGVSISRSGPRIVVTWPFETALTVRSAD